MRIVAGEFGGRRLVDAEGRARAADGRPGARGVDEHPRRALPGARVLDLFAGQRGARARGAVARRAARPTFVELQSALARGARANIAALGVGDGTTVHRGDALRFAEHLDAGAVRRRLRRSAVHDRTTPRGWWRSSAEPLSRAFFRSSIAPTRRCTATTPAATAIPPSPSSTRHDPHRGLPRLVRSADEGPRGPGPPQPGARRPRSSSRWPSTSASSRSSPSRSGSRCSGPRSATTRGSHSQSFDGLLAEFAKKVGATIIVRGLRAVSDFEYEFQMALMNRQLHPSLETVFLVPAVDLTYLSSSLVREVARFGGDVQRHGPSGRGRALGAAVPFMSFRRRLLERAAADGGPGRALRGGRSHGSHRRRNGFDRERVVEPIVLGGPGLDTSEGSPTRPDRAVLA